MPLTEQEILELATQIKAQDTVFMKKGRLDIQKLEKIGTPSGSVEPRNYNYKGIIEVNNKKQLNIELSGNRKSGYWKSITNLDNAEFNYTYFNYPLRLASKSALKGEK